MPFKFLLIIILMSFFTLSASAQKQNVYFLKNDLTQVDTKDSADFIRVISEPDSGTNLYNIKEYYKNGKLKLAGKTSYINVSFLQGPCLSFYPSGKRKQIATYKNDDMIGNVYDYYPNGALYRIKKYSTTTRATFNGERIDFTLIASQDSTGKPCVVDSTGYYIDYNANFKKIREEGMLKNGKRDGEWKGCGSEKDSILSFNETYDNGKLLKGTSTGLDNHIYTYEKREIEPEYIGGEDGFGRFLRDNVHYPKESKELNETGKVYITFVVQKNGKIFNVGSSKYASKNLAIESVRVVIKSSGNWKPAIRFGKTIVCEYIVPINFTLSTD